MLSQNEQFLIADADNCDAVAACLAYVVTVVVDKSVVKLNHDDDDDDGLLMLVM